MVRKLKRILVKMYIKWFKKSYMHIYTLKSEYEPLAINICRRAIQKEGVKLLVCPITNKRYIQNENIENYIIISEDKIDIINHQYSYNIPICLKTYKTISLIFDGHVGEMRDKMEKEIRSNISFSLEHIYKRLTF